MAYMYLTVLSLYSTWRGLAKNSIPLSTLKLISIYATSTGRLFHLLFQVIKTLLPRTCKLQLVSFCFFLHLKGMQVKGIYRVNGNAADINLIEQKVEESKRLILSVF